jgi:hypothetical protein
MRPPACAGRSITSFINCTPLKPAQLFTSNAAAMWRGSRPDALVGVARKPCFGRRSDACALTRRHRPGGIVEIIARLDFDEYQQPPAPGDEIDFADGRLPAPGENAKAFGDEERSRPALGRQSGAEGQLALRVPGRNIAAAATLLAHAFASAESLSAR